MSESITVTVIPDGPLKITNARSLAFGEQVLVAEGAVFLCRCGRSANAPYCDGSHKRVGFDGGCASPPTKEIRTWEGRTLGTFFNPNTCMHAAFCKPLKALRERELSGDDEAAAEIMQVIDSCPSGALTFEAHDTTEPAPTATGADVLIMVGGEVRVQGAFEINAPLLARQHAERATLCRCGESRNKPWCDGRHKGRKDFR